MQRSLNQTLKKRRPTFEKNYSTGFGKRAYFPGFGKRHHDSDNRVFHGLEKNKETSSSHELKMPYLDTDSIPEWKELEIFYPNSYDSYSKQNMNSDEDFGEPDSDNGYLLNNFNLLPYGADIQEKPFIEKNELRGIMSPIDGPADSSKMYNGFAEKINQGIVRQTQNGDQTKGITQLLKKLLSQRGEKKSYPVWQ